MYQIGPWEAVQMRKHPPCLPPSVLWAQLSIMVFSLGQDVGLFSSLRLFLPVQVNHNKRGARSQIPV